MPRTSGRTTIGIWIAATTNTPSRPIDTSNRQLHWPRRSSQIGTSGFVEICVLGSTPRTETTRAGDGQREGDDRDRREQADDPGEGGPGRQRDERDRRMDVDGLVVDDRRQELALDEVEDPDQDEQDDRLRSNRRSPR